MGEMDKLKIVRTVYGSDFLAFEHFSIGIFIVELCCESGIAYLIRPADSMARNPDSSTKFRSIEGVACRWSSLTIYSSIGRFVSVSAKVVQLVTGSISCSI